jgi:hypothetical protein
MVSCRNAEGRVYVPSKTALSKDDFPAPVAPHIAIIVRGGLCLSRLG